MTDQMLRVALPGVDDEEAPRVPAGLPTVVDAHVHLFPDGLFRAIWSWFDQHGWPIRYRLSAEAVIAFLLERGVSHIVALHYAHKPGVARGLNRHMAALCRAQPRISGTATVFPGEENATEILEQAFAEGLFGVKLHAHVQGLDLESAPMQGIYACCAANGMPLVMHAGREPRSPAYARDPYETCGAVKVERVLRRNPRLLLCVPHLGTDELEPFRRLLEQHDNLWLDTTMALANYLPGPGPPALESYRADRLIYGSDFPNIPYAWSRELAAIAAWNLPPPLLERLLWRNASELFGLPVA